MQRLYTLAACLTRGKRAACPPLRTIRHTLEVATSHDARRDVLGVGIVLRAPAQRADRRAGPIVAEHAEAWAVLPPGATAMFAVLRALEIAWDKQLRVVRVRLTESAARKALKKKQLCAAGREEQSVQGAVLRLARSFDLVQFGHARRNVNARRLARKAVASLPPQDDHPILASLPPRPRTPPQETSWHGSLFELEPEIDEERQVDPVYDLGADQEIPF